MGKRLNAHQIKIIAIFGMTLDHFAIAFSDKISFAAKIPLYLLGGITFPVMGYLLVQGFNKTRNANAYAFRLFVWALLAQYPYMRGLRLNQLNVLFTLLICLMILIVEQKIGNCLLFDLLLSASAIATHFYCDWGGLGILLVYAFTKIEDEHKKICLPIIALSLLKILSRCFRFFATEISTRDLISIALSTIFYIGCLLAIPLLLSYNGKRGHPMRHFFYIYYPLHIVALFLLQQI